MKTREFGDRSHLLNNLSDGRRFHPTRFPLQLREELVEVTGHFNARHTQDLPLKVD